MSLPQSLTDLGFKLMGGLHRAVLQLSGGRVGGTIAGMPVVELRTTGRTSGQQRSTTLTAPIADESRVVLVASKGGADRDPDWYRNLVANPEVEVEFGDDRFTATAVPITSGPERDRLYAAQVAVQPGFADYEKATTRVIPIVELRRS